MQHFEIKVLGPGCKRCDTLKTMLEDAAAKAGVEASVIKITDMAEIARYGIAATPGVVINENVVHAGGLPKDETISAWFAATQP